MKTAKSHATAPHATQGAAKGERPTASATADLHNEAGRHSTALILRFMTCFNVEPCCAAVGTDTAAGRLDLTIQKQERHQSGDARKWRRLVNTAKNECDKLLDATKQDGRN